MRPWRVGDHSPPSSAAVMEEYSYTSTHPLVHSGPVTGSLHFSSSISISSSSGSISSNSSSSGCSSGSISSSSSSSIVKDLGCVFT